MRFINSVVNVAMMIALARMFYAEHVTAKFDPAKANKSFDNAFFTMCFIVVCYIVAIMVAL